MKDIREMLNISYFDNKELSLKEHCDIYSNIKKDVISILNKYDIKYVIANTESIRDLSSKNRELKKQLEEYKRLGFKHLNDKCNKLENQQKEFISYLENCINELKKESMNELQNAISLGVADITKEILSKYKSIIGDNK